MSSENQSPEAKAKVSTASSAPPPRKKKKRQRRFLTEKEINVPDVQTLGMVGVMAGLSITLWIFAHAGCNYHPPRETRRPRNVTTQELTRDPKDAVIELSQRLATADYKGALEIAAGPLVESVNQERARCETDATGCAARKKAAANAITSAIVLDRQSTNAKVRVTTHRLPDGAKTYLALAERDGTTWKVTARVPDAPDARLPAPSLPQPEPMQLMPTPGGSAPGLPVPGTRPPSPHP